MTYNNNALYHPQRQIDAEEALDRARLDWLTGRVQTIIGDPDLFSDALEGMTGEQQESFETVLRKLTSYPASDTQLMARLRATLDDIVYRKAESDARFELREQEAFSAEVSQ